MKRITIILSILVFILSAQVFPVSTKFDVGAAINLGGYRGFGNGAAAGPLNATGANAVTRDMNLVAYNIGGTLTMDLIFLAEDKKYYGMGPSLVVNILAIEQNFSSSLFSTNGQEEDEFVGNPLSQQMLSTIHIQIAPMYRFFISRNISVGIGPSINIIANAGDRTYLDSPHYFNPVNPTIGTSNFFISPMFGPVYISALADIQITKFFGNFGVTGGLGVSVLFQPIAVGLNATFGIKYRFNP